MTFIFPRPDGSLQGKPVSSKTHWDIFTHSTFVAEISVTEKSFHSSQWGGFGSKHMYFCKTHLDETEIPARNLLNENLLLHG